MVYVGIRRGTQKEETVLKDSLSLSSLF